MRGRYFTNLILIGLLPLLVVAGGAFYTLLLQKPAAPVLSTDTVDSKLQAVQVSLSAISQSMAGSIQKTYTDIVTLAAQPSDEAFQNFVVSHPGVSAVFHLNGNGAVQKQVPDGAGVVDEGYGATEEFSNIAERLFKEGKNPYQFLTARLPYTAFIFTSPGPDSSIVGTALNLEKFFEGLDLKGGEVLLLEAGSGRVLYHSDRAKIGQPFNAAQEPWLAKAQEDLKNKTAGKVLNGDVSAAAYYPLGIASFGVVQVVPHAALLPPPPPPKDVREKLQEILLTPLSLSLCVALAWWLLVGAFRLKPTLKPMQDALALVQRASGGGAAVTDEDLRKVGSDEPGKLVSAAVQWAQRLDQERSAQVQERDDEIRRTKTNLQVNLDGKTKEVNLAAQQLGGLKTDLEQARQQLADKMKELDAMKGMTDGLRTQSEQAKGENAKLKSRIAGLEEQEKAVQGKVAESEHRLKEMESKLLKAVSSSSAIRVSQVRVAAIRTMAEELKTTLGIIKGYVSSALGSAQGGITEKQQEFLGMVINRSARLEKFINDLMDIYLVEIEQEGAVRESVNLASEIEGLAFNYQAQADIKSLKIKVEAKPDVPKVPVVRRRFTQLWNILYLQMIKDAPRNTTLQIGVESMGEDVKVSIHDPGLIIKDEHLPKVFDEFYDPKHPASPQLAGTGLKFALVKTILAAHGGGAVAEKANPGTQLILTFPTQVKKKVEPTLPAPAPKSAAQASPVSPAPAPAAVAPGVPKTAAPGVKIPTFGPLPSIPKPASPVLSSPERGTVPTPPPQVPASTTVVPPATPPPAKPPVPGTAGASAPPKPSAPAPSPYAPGALDSLLGKGIAAAPATPSGSPIPPPQAAPNPPAVAPPAAKPPAPTGGLEALLAGLGKVPPPPAPGLNKPPVPPAPASPGIVTNSMKPTAPPPGILDLDNTDSFKIDDATAKKPAPMPGAPPAPKSSAPPPGAPPAGGTSANKPIVKDLNKDSGADSELID